MTPPRPPAAGRLGGAPVALLALGVTVPAAVVAGARPLIFLGLGLLLLTFAAGYVTMARRMPHPAPLYCFVARGLGRPLGLGAAALALLSYTALQLALYGTVGAAVAPLLDGWFGITAAWWVVALCCWAVVAGCGLLRIPAAAWLVAVLVLAELVVIIGYGAANVLDPAGGGITWAALSPASLADLPRPMLGLLLVGGALAFVGFETTAIYSDQPRHPHRAAYLCVAAIAVLTAAAGWAMSVAAGPGRIAAVDPGRTGPADAGQGAAWAGARGPELMFDLAAERLAPWLVTLGRAVLVAGLLAAMIALHLVITRYLVALGRERVLPPALGRGVAASLTQTVVVGAVLGACAYADVGLGRGVGVAGGLGILALLPVTSLAALLFLNRNPGEAGVWGRFLAPALSTVGLGVLGYLAARDLPALLGVPVGRVWVGPAAAGAAILLGIGYGLVLRRAAPVSYAGVGLGGAAVVVSPVSLPIPQPRNPGAHRPERINREVSH
ncbi:APC family permease [Actinoplanes sp. ATCC 53533]|uniref:APC family permease n=1 Tax=Actinoplanes sp. ATCC 53533 TaxID=1288362 RepID=UPI001F2A8B1B|nr:APC family permease [Actinoplanes sp. ATCC 53533]